MGDVPGPDGVEPQGRLAAPRPLGPEPGAVHVIFRAHSTILTAAVNITLSRAELHRYTLLYNVLQLLFLL